MKSGRYSRKTIGRRHKLGVADFIFLTGGIPYTKRLVWLIGKSEILIHAEAYIQPSSF